MGTKHTPGPWKAEGWENVVVNAACGSTIVACPGASKGAGIGEVRANSRLIAAAPDLLEIARERAAELSKTRSTTTTGEDARKAALAKTLSAIAKAEGR